jgi:hypothetical protein
MVNIPAEKCYVTGKGGHEAGLSAGWREPGGCTDPKQMGIPWILMIFALSA